MTNGNLPTPREISGEFDLVEYYDNMNKVVEEMLKGHSVPQIARTLNMKRTAVTGLIDQWQSIARNTNEIQDRASDAIYGADQHYSMIIQRLWETVEQVDSLPDYRTKNAVLKSIADVEQKRIDMLQKAGLLENQDLAKQILENERKQKAIMDILREVAADCEHCRANILKKLSDINKDGVGVSV